LKSIKVPPQQLSAVSFQQSAVSILVPMDKRMETLRKLSRAASFERLSKNPLVQGDDAKQAAYYLKADC
jgi:hypothetical protein